MLFFVYQVFLSPHKNVVVSESFYVSKHLFSFVLLQRVLIYHTCIHFSMYVCVCTFARDLVLINEAESHDVAQAAKHFCSTPRTSLRTATRKSSLRFDEH